MTKGKFITFEGGEGAGKSTQARLLSQRLNRLKIAVTLTREPGGSPFAEAIRGVLLDPSYPFRSDLAELMMFYAARADHLESKIKPALEVGQWVICDRFSDSTRAYQGAASGVDPGLIDTFENIVVGESAPDLTVILDVDPEVGAKRAIRRAYGSVNSQSRLFEPEQLAFSFAPDRFEALDVAFHRSVRSAFLKIAADNPTRCVVIPSVGGITSVADQVYSAVVNKLDIPVLNRKSLAS
jgi:dTMP kinase